MVNHFTILCPENKTLFQPKTSGNRLKYRLALIKFAREGKPAYKIFFIPYNNYIVYAIYVISVNFLIKHNPF